MKWKRYEYELENDHSEWYNCGNFCIYVRAMTWSNKEQRRLPVDETTRWGAYVGRDCSAIAIDFPSIDAAKAAALEVAAKRLETDMNIARLYLADVKKAQKHIS